MGLSIPYHPYKGSLRFEIEDQDKATYSNSELKKFLVFLQNSSNSIGAKFDLSRLEQDLDSGMHFDSSIPEGFGVGSSGAIVAAIYDHYCINAIPSDESITGAQLKRLKKIFGEMEAYFHGKSSGLDPLICYLKLPVLIKSKSEMNTVGLPAEGTGNGAIFLLDTGMTGKTQPLVNLFMERCKEEGFRTMLKKEFKKYNDACIHAFLDRDVQPLMSNVKELSKVLLAHFKPMIPSVFHKLWKDGIDSNAYYLKLCGSGGGGFILGFTDDFEKASSMLNEYELSRIYHSELMTPQLLSRRSRYILYKFYALLSLVRWYNVLIMTLALYLSAIYFFPPKGEVLATLKDMRLHLEIASLCLFIMSGFIVNAFYDVEKDMINRPDRTFFDRHISRSFSFKCYFLFNTLAGILSLMVHWKVFLINVLFSVVLWLYSHKMRKKRFMAEIGAAFLTVAPFFSLAVYYETVTLQMLEFVALIFIMIFGREIVKKLIGLKGDFILGDQSLPIYFGEKWGERIVIGLSLLTCMQAAFFIRFLVHGEAAYAFYAMAAMSILVIITIWPMKDYRWANRLYKVLIILCILSIPFI